MQLKPRKTSIRRLTAALTFSWLLYSTTLSVDICAAAGNLDAVKRAVGSSDSVLVADPENNVILSLNSDKPLIPASILKLLTSLVAIHYLGLDYRFVTEFYIDSKNNLKIKGYGDPLLVSEVISDIARQLAGRLDTVNDIVVDDSYFVQPLEIPGVSNSTEPYDAPNGALCVNFNTVYFKKKSGVYVSAESQTPLLPFALNRVKRSKLDRGRIVLSHNENECTLYAGYLFDYFLGKEGINTGGNIVMGTVQADTDKLIYRHVSRYSLEEIISKLLNHSNNYTTNQVLIAIGIDVYGPPGTLAKGVRAVTAYAKDILQLQTISITEGSGISRHNRLSARDMHKVLVGFKPYRYLMRLNGRQYYKTGTLRGINTRAGYLKRADGQVYSFVVMINTPGKSTNGIVENLLKELD